MEDFMTRRKMIGISIVVGVVMFVLDTILLGATLTDGKTTAITWALFVPMFVGIVIYIRWVDRLLAPRDLGDKLQTTTSK